MRAHHLIIGTAALLLAGACGAPPQTAPVVPVAAPVAAEPTPTAETETVTVASVADGDTFTLTDGRTVRVLGIDSCESGTRAGRAATAEAAALIDDRTVTLRPEHGVDLDPFGRALRYVVVPDGRDLGTIMVARPHTAVYERGDAAASYVSALRAVEDGPRTCTGPASATAVPRSARPAAPSATPAPDTAAPKPRTAAEPAPKRAPAPQPAVGQRCHPSYTPCVPAGPDLDCPDIGHSVRVIGPDSFRLDADHDGVGCE